MFMKLFSAVLLFTATGTAMAGVKCFITIFHPMVDNGSTLTSPWTIAAAICLMLVLTVRLLRNRSQV